MRNHNIDALVGGYKSPRNFPVVPPHIMLVSVPDQHLFFRLSDLVNHQVNLGNLILAIGINLLVEGLRMSIMGLHFVWDLVKKVLSVVDMIGHVIQFTGLSVQKIAQVIGYAIIISAKMASSIPLDKVLMWLASLLPSLLPEDSELVIVEDDDEWDDDEWDDCDEVIRQPEHPDEVD
jgi:D-alanine-D-alanine ligase-like ATP-grasp enzyme